MKKLFQFLSIGALMLIATNGLRAQCSPNFTFTVGSNGVVNFVSTSVGTSSATAYYWSFGNNTYSNGINQQTGSATYTTNGYYQVTLWVTDTLSNGPCNGYFTDTILVNTAGCNDVLVINNQQMANGVVNFYTSLTTPMGISGQSWTFGDGGTSNNINPLHTYTASGLYPVTVTATVGICTYTATKTISVTIGNCNLNAGFTYSLSNNGVAHFFNTSTGTSSTTTYYWYFGDGTNASGANVTHTYNMNSTYGVILMVSDSINVFGCKDSTMKVLNITTAGCFNNTSFSIAKDSLVALTWNAMPVYPFNVTGATWSWGDGSSSTGLYPSHTYSAAGMYTICVSTTLTCGSPTTACWAGSIYRTSGGNSSMVTVNVLNPNTSVGISQVSRENKQIKCYPSPVADMLTIEGLGNTAVSISIFNVVGKEVRSESINPSEEGKTTLDVSALSSGIYYLRVEKNGIVESSKLIKQ